MVFPLLKTWLEPFFPSRTSSNTHGKAYKIPGSEFVTIGGSGGSASSRNRKGPRSASYITDNVTLDNESEECIVNRDSDVHMQHMHTTGETQRSSNAMIVSKQVSLETKDCSSEQSAAPF